jgi:hypothetical protein
MPHHHRRPQMGSGEVSIVQGIASSTVDEEGAYVLFLSTSSILHPRGCRRVSQRHDATMWTFQEK